jgi:hypothetical protein
MSLDMVLTIVSYVGTGRIKIQNIKKEDVWITNIEDLVKE